MAGRQYGLNIEDVQSIVFSSIGGDNVGEVIDGLARIPINVRCPRDSRDSVEQLRALPSSPTAASRSHCPMWSRWCRAR